MTRPLAITLGDPAGIGTEVTLKALCPDVPTVLIGSLQLLDMPAVRRWTRDLNIVPASSLDIESMEFSPGQIAWIDPAPQITIDPGQETSEPNGKIALASILLATDLALRHKVRAIVTAPISKRSFQLAGAPELDHTRLFGRLTKTEPTMGFYSEKMIVVLTTIHCPLSQVPSLISEELLERTIRRTHHWLRSLGCKSPRIAVAGLNPHAGEEGLMGTEEIMTIRPTILKLQSEFPGLSGPYPADTLFWKADRFDCIIAQYHDQGLAPLKMVAFDTAVNTTLGLPFVRTSPDHGTAFDIAYQDLANPSSMTAAIQLALRMSNGN